jgi:acetolactate synthase regulatory subunit
LFHVFLKLKKILLFYMESGANFGCLFRKAGRIIFVMNTEQRTFRLRLDRCSAMDAAEAVLATLRRGGVRLDAMRMAPGVHGMNLDLDVAAEGEDALVLARMRLCNLIGVLKIRVQARAYAPI